MLKAKSSQNGRSGMQVSESNEEAHKKKSRQKNLLLCCENYYFFLYLSSLPSKVSFFAIYYFMQFLK